MRRCVAGGLMVPPEAVLDRWRPGLLRTRLRPVWGGNRRLLISAGMPGLSQLRTNQLCRQHYFLTATLSASFTLTNAAFYAVRGLPT